MKEEWDEVGKLIEWTAREGAASPEHRRQIHGLVLGFLLFSIVEVIGIVIFWAILLSVVGIFFRCVVCA